MSYIRYEIVENGNLKLADNVETYGDLTKKEWHERITLKYANLHKRFAICHSENMTALLFMAPDGNLKLVEKVEKYLELSDTHFWHVRVKCQHESDYFHVMRSENEDAQILYLETLAYHLNEKKLLVKREQKSYVA